MSDHTSRVIERVGSSTASVDEAISDGIEGTSQTIEHLRWSQAGEIGGHNEGGRVTCYQAALSVGFALRGSSPGVPLRRGRRWAPTRTAPP